MCAHLAPLLAGSVAPHVVAFVPPDAAAAAMPCLELLEAAGSVRVRAVPGVAHVGLHAAWGKGACLTN